MAIFLTVSFLVSSVFAESVSDSATDSSYFRVALCVVLSSDGTVTSGKVDETSSAVTASVVSVVTGFVCETVVETFSVLETVVTGTVVVVGSSVAG